MSSHPTTREPAFPTQAELRAVVAEMEANPLSRHLFLDALRFRAIVDLDGVVVALNDYAREQRGTDVDLILNRPMWDDPIFGGDPLWEGRLRARFAEALASPTGIIEYEDRADLPGGELLIVLVRVSTVKNAAGEPIGFLVDSADIGREHRSRELVREQQRLLHVVFERTFQLIAILEPDGTILDVNDAIGRIGLTREAALGRTIMDLGAAESPERAAQWQERVDAMQTATEARRYFDVRPAGRGQGHLATDVSMTPVRNDDGTLDLILLEFRDQSERYAAEERLRESEERFRVIAETLPQMVWSRNADNTFDYMSPGWEEFSGLALADIVAGRALHLVHPDDHATVLAPMPPPGEDDYRVFRMRNRHGEYRWLESQARSVLDDDGNIRRWYGATLDITERREADERALAQSEQIAAAASLTGLGSFVWDNERRVLHTDERFDQIIGVDLSPRGDEGETDGQAIWTERLHPDDRHRIVGAIAATLTPGGPKFNEQYRLLVEGPAGPEERWVACVASADFTDAGELRRLYGAIQDVTTARRQDEARIRLQKVEAIGTLVGAIAHDFNNVIGAILTYARVAEAEMERGEVPAESVAEIARGARRASDILGRVMTFGREERTRRVAFDGADVIREALALLRPALPSSTTLRTEIAEDLPPIIGDATQVHQVIVNLVTNAGQVLDGQEDGEILVAASAITLLGEAADREGIEPGDYVRIVVQDNGPGFADGAAHRLFDPFFTTKPTGKGTGLGLAAVQSIVQAHHGAVSASEPSGAGARFTVVLPVARDHAIQAMPPPRPAEPEGKSDAEIATPERVTTTPPQTADGAERGARRHALFVDDEPALVRLAGRAMPYRDIEVTGHTDAAEAAAAFTANPDAFDVLITDLSMPTMSGFDLIATIRAIRPDFPVVLTSGYLGPADEQRARELEIDAVLPKPCSIDALASAVARVTRS